MAITISGTDGVGITGNVGALTAGTAVASTSGTSIDFTGIPSWAKRITVMFNGVSTSGVASMVVQIGSGSFTTTGYVGRGGYILNPNAASVISITNGLAVEAFGAAVETRTGMMVITLLSGSTYVSSCQVSSNANAAIGYGASNITLGGVLDRVRITTTNGTDTFDAGSINILFE